MISIFQRLELLQARLREFRIPFAITSGMAAVHYGIQQTTKDSDWIISAEHLEKFVELLAALEKGPEHWRPTYRPIFGSPLIGGYLKHGWSSHLAVSLPEETVEMHVDIFSAPPRVPRSLLAALPNGYVNRHILALMKRTDRDKDWPVVFACGAQMAVAGESESILHVQDEEWLAEALKPLSQEQVNRLALSRPLLSAIRGHPHKARRYLLLERTIWQEVNKERYRPYQQASKNFLRRLRQEAVDTRPAGTFLERHRQIIKLCQTYGLPENPLEGILKSDLVENAMQSCRELLAATEEELRSVAPPVEVLLP